MDTCPTLIQMYGTAHDRWRDDWSMEDFRNSLQGIESTAVHFAQMDRQVTNGGWGQWYVNGCYTPEVLSFLKLRVRLDLEQTPAVVEMQRILEEVGSIFDSADANMNYVDDDMCVALALLDDAYFNIDAGVLDSVESWLVAHR